MSRHVPTASPPEASVPNISIYQEVRRRICMLQYPHGTVLREAELAEEFGVSRTPVREVLQRLMSDGLVEVRHGVGNLVLAGDRSTFDDIYTLRLEIAGLIGKLARAPDTAAAVAAMEVLQERIESLRQSRDLGQFWQINEGRHKIINGLIENRELAQLHDLYYYKMAPFWFGLCSVALDEEIDLLRRELTETLFWLRTGDVGAVAGTHRNFTALGMTRVREFLLT